MSIIQIVMCFDRDSNQRRLSHQHPPLQSGGTTPFRFLPQGCVLEKTTCMGVNALHVGGYQVLFATSFSPDTVPATAPPCRDIHDSMANLVSNHARSPSIPQFAPQPRSSRRAFFFPALVHSHAPHTFPLLPSAPPMTSPPHPHLNLNLNLKPCHDSQRHLSLKPQLPAQDITS